LTAWTLEGFGEGLDRWAESEDPNADLRLVVTSWVLSRFDDPYQGVRRERGFSNLWFGVVPNTLHDGGKVVVCSYWVKEAEHIVRCDNFGTLNLPI
jgi:hypothetical protein